MSLLRYRVNLRVSQTTLNHNQNMFLIVSYSFCSFGEFVKVLEGQVWRVRVAHLHHKPFLEFRTPFRLLDIRENPRSTCARVPLAMAQFVLKIEKIVPHDGNNSNTRNGARLRSPSLIMAPDGLKSRIFANFSCGIFGHVTRFGPIERERKCLMDCNQHLDPGYGSIAHELVSPN